MGSGDRDKQDKVMGRDFLIFGTGGHAKVVASIIERSGDYVMAFVEPHSEDSEGDFMGYPIIDESQASDKYHMALGVGDFNVRKKIMYKFEFADFPPIIDPTAVVHSNVIGKGTVVCPMAYIGVDTAIGDGCIINTKASIDHDCRVGDYVNINPGVVLCGTVTVDSSLYIAAGKVVINNQHVTKNIKGEFLNQDND